MLPPMSQACPGFLRPEIHQNLLGVFPYLLCSLIIGVPILGE